MLEPPTTALAVFYGQERVGTVRDTSPLVFEYAETWLARQPPKPLSAIPLQAGPISSALVEAYFENLLPEGELRVYIAEQRKASTLFAMLLEVAGDTVGAFVLLPEGQAPPPPHYEPTTWEAIAAALAKTSAAAIDLKGRGARISLAGAQDKASIAIFDDGQPQLPRGTAPSTHILKPNIRRLAKVRESAINETLVMLAAVAMAKALDMGSGFTLGLAKNLAEKIPAALDQAFADLQHALSPAGRVFAEKLVMWVKASTKKMARRLED